MTWNIIQQEGVKGDLYKSNRPGGNVIALKLVMLGMKLQPCSPGFVDGRNAILKADTLLYGGAYSSLIWKAFAKRGLGIYASQGSSYSYTDGKADFTEPPPSPAAFASSNANASKQNTTHSLKPAGISISPNPAKNIVTITVSNNSKPLKIILLTAAGKQLATYNMNNNMLQINLPNLSPGMYFVKIAGDDFSSTNKLVIQ